MCVYIRIGWWCCVALSAWATTTCVLLRQLTGTRLEFRFQLEENTYMSTSVYVHMQRCWNSDGSQLASDRTGLVFEAHRLLCHSV